METESLGIHPLKLRTAVVILAQEKPDNTYSADYEKGSGPGCSYYRGHCSDGSVGCILGQALVRFGANEELLKNCDDAGSISEVLKNPNLQEDILSEGACTEDILWLRKVQSEQDLGHTWAEAVKEADEELRIRSGLISQ